MPGCPSFIYRVPEHLVDVFNKIQLEQQEFEDKRMEERLKKWGDSYWDIFATVDTYIPAPTNTVVYDAVYESEPPRQMCYLCRTMIEPCLSGEYFGMCVYRDAGDITFRDGWDRIKSTMFKPHYACFDCRKVWKPLERSDAEMICQKGIRVTLPKHTRCSSCHRPGVYMGLNFRAPKKKDTKGWHRAKEIIERDPMAFEARCKCHS
jgi:hypothetical protein